LWNHRSDNWGGSLENRARYGVAVLKAVREATGDWPAIAKLNCEDGIEGGVTHDDVIFFAQRLAEAGIEALTISGGSPRLPARSWDRQGSPGRGKRVKTERPILPRPPPKSALLSVVKELSP
jgi:2,4-dienoyl-CoA reductase-like NADH-dependent reductase (Old Yellow Enzyme family)